MIEVTMEIRIPCYPDASAEDYRGDDNVIILSQDDDGPSTVKITMPCSGDYTYILLSDLRDAVSEITEVAEGNK